MYYEFKNYKDQSGNDYIDNNDNNDIHRQFKNLEN